MRYIIGSLVGAVIGYITNWLAIKMLFRPHNEIRIGSLKVPFTPGLIPKEKSRIARSVGETIGKHLLTKDTIIESLCSDNMNKQLDLWVQNKISDIEDRGATVEDEMRGLMGDEYPAFIEHVKAGVSRFLISYMNEETSKEAVAEFVKNQIISGLSIKPKEISRSELYNSIKDKLLKGVIKYRDSEEFNSHIQRLLEGKAEELREVDDSLGEIIPESIRSSIREYVYLKRRDMAMGIKELLKQEKVRQKLRQLVGETIGANLNPMIAMFINADKIYEKVLIGIHEFLDDEKNHEDIALAVNGIIDEFMKSSPSDILSQVPQDGIDAGISSLIDLFKEKVLHDGFLTDTLERVEDRFESYESIGQMLQEAGIDYESFIDGFVKERIDDMKNSDSFKKSLEGAVSQMIHKALALDLRSILNGARDNVPLSISRIVRDLYNKFIENKAADVIEVLDVAGIVEDKINEFEVDYAEEIILEISSKELRAITWLGALLGAIMGLLSPIIGSLY